MTENSPAAFETDEVRELVGKFRDATGKLREEIGKMIIGQGDVVEHLLVTLLVGGHCLITGMPGTAKTCSCARWQMRWGSTFNRIQFTPDLMPTDVTGTDIIEEDASGHRSWTFVRGPIFTNVLLADEINRTPPKTQAALLEAMQEKSVTVRGELINSNRRSSSSRHRIRSSSKAPTRYRKRSSIDSCSTYCSITSTPTKSSPCSNASPHASTSPRSRR